MTCLWSWWQKKTSILHLDSLKLIYHCMHWFYFPDLSSIQTPVVTSVTEATRPCRSIKCYKWSLSLSNNGGRRGLRALLRNNDECSLSLSLCTSAGGPPGTSDEEVMIFLWFHMTTPNKHKETPKKTQKQKDTTCTSLGGFWKLQANKEFGAFSWFQIITRNKHQTNTNK